MNWTNHVSLSFCYIIMLFFRMMSTESANSFTLIGEASDGGTMENLSRRLKVGCSMFFSAMHIFQTVVQFEYLEIQSSATLNLLWCYNGATARKTKFFRVEAWFVRQAPMKSFFFIFCTKNHLPSGYRWFVWHHVWSDRCGSSSMWGMYWHSSGPVGHTAQYHWEWVSELQVSKNRVQECSRKYCLYSPKLFLLNAVCAS